MNIVSIDQISKSYGDKILFQDISFGIEENDKIGVIGVNGTGKSTLLKIIAKQESADCGSLTIGNKVRIQYLPQNPSFDEEKTVLEQVFLGDSQEMKIIREYEEVLERLTYSADSLLQHRILELSNKMDMFGLWDFEAHAKAILTKLGISFFGSKIKTLSGGQRKRVAMARALIHPSELLILDEPTNHIDNDTVSWLEEYLAQRKGALLLITHDRYFLDRVANRIIEIDKGNLYSYKGNYELFLEKRIERETQSIVQEEKRQNLLRKELAWLHRGAKARSTKQKAHIQRIENLQSIEEYKPEYSLEIGVKSHRLGKKVIELSHIEKSYKDRKIINDFSYIIHPRERLGIIGENGKGKSTLLNIMAGKIKPDYGKVEIGETVKLAYYTQENIDLDESLRVIDYIKEQAYYIETNQGKTLSASKMLEKFLFSEKVQYNYINKLSGGEKRRLYLLGILMQEPNVLFLDEPTNDLDLQTLQILEDYIEEFKGAVVIVSHDRYFLDKTVDHVLVFEDTGIYLYLGGYSDYIVKRNEKSLEIKKEKKEEKLDFKEQKKSITKLSYNEKKEYEEIEDVISQVESELEEINQKIKNAGSDYVLLEELLQKQKNIEKILEEKIERWDYLNNLVQTIERMKNQPL